MNPHYILKIIIRDDDRVPYRHSYAHYKNELVISDKGNIIDYLGTAAIKEFNTEVAANDYAKQNQARFDRLYGSVTLRAYRQHYPVAASL